MLHCPQTKLYMECASPTAISQGSYSQVHNRPPLCNSQIILWTLIPIAPCEPTIVTESGGKSDDWKMSTEWHSLQFCMAANQRAGLDHHSGLDWTENGKEIKRPVQEPDTILSHCSKAKLIILDYASKMGLE